MADPASQKASPANGAAADTPRESIDQVRDLLFGSQMRMVESRLQSLDEKISHEASAIRMELKSLGEELRQSIKSLERRQASFEEAASRADADLRDHLLKQSASLTSDLKATSERITSELDKVTTRLQTEKLDAAALAIGLNDLAGRLAVAPPPIAAPAPKQAPPS